MKENHRRRDGEETKVKIGREAIVEETEENRQRESDSEERPRRLNRGKETEGNKQEEEIEENRKRGEREKSEDGGGRDIGECQNGRSRGGKEMER